jgi:hypothetical protein
LGSEYNAPQALRYNLTEDRRPTTSQRSDYPSEIPMSRLTLLSLTLILILLTACAPTPPLPTGEGWGEGTPPLPSGEGWGEGTATPAPTLIATATPTPTETPTPTPQDILSPLHLPPDFSAQLKSEGIAKTISGAEGNWQISQVISGWNQDGTPILENDIQIVSLQVAAVHNEGYPNGILTGTDAEGKTVFWSEEEKAWIRPLEFSTDIEKPTAYPWGKQYLAVESALLDPDLNAPFPQEAVDNFLGWSIQFIYDPKTDSSHAYLRSRDMTVGSARWALDKNGQPVWFTTTAPDGTVYQSILIQLLNPKDPAHPKADETMFVLATAGEWWINTKHDTYRNFFERLYLVDSNIFDGTSPSIELAEKNGWFAKQPWGSFPPRPSLDSLLNQTEKNARQIIGVGPYLDHLNELGPNNIDPTTKKPITLLEYGVAHLDNSNNIIFDPLWSDFQKLLFALSFTTK